ncbi:hypothetical protein L9F63_025829 [Diploptera punctata]|uniref:UDP-glucose:glycoprotein glucosyltransferase n=1 Tax=Diploptera punctata TaxID=6984 RepID=A0AAD8E2U5_DIPPU|nr:hypothetical protein L9F63_025829 [Diploptera punctata]
MIYKNYSTKMQLLVLGILVLLYSGAGDASKQKGKSVTTLIEAKWEVTPLVFEVAEYLADENAEYLWEYVDAVCALQPALADLESDRYRYEQAVDVAGFMITPAQVSVLKLALSLHIYSPKVEMYSQMALERGVTSLSCPIVADLGDEQQSHCNPVWRIGNSRVCKVPSAAQDIRHQGRTLIMLSDIMLRNDLTNECACQVMEWNCRLNRQNIKCKMILRLKQLYPDMRENLDKLRLHLIESSNEMAPLKVWQVQELSLQAAERIMNSPKEEALKVLTNTAQNFPLQARSLVRTVVKEDLKQEIKRNQEMFSSSLNLQSSDTALFVNGMFFDLDVIDVISLLEVIRQELRVMEGLHKIGIRDPYMRSLLSLDFSSGSSSTPEYAIDIRDSAVMWINDIEHDKQYRRWSDSLMELLRPTFPGMLRSVRRNLYNLVILANPAKKEAKPLLKLAESFYVHTAPLRIGLVFAVNPDQSVSGQMDAGVALLNAFNYVSDVKDAYHGLSFITDVYATLKEDRDIEVEDVISLLRTKYRSADVDEIFGEDSEYDTGRRLARDFVERSGFRKMPQALINGIPIGEKHLNGEDFEEAVLSEIMNQTPLYQKAVYKGEFTESDSALDFIMNQPNVMPRLNDRVLSQDKSQYLDVTGQSLAEEVPLTLQTFSSLSPRDKTATMIDRGLVYYRGNILTSLHML